MIATVMGVKGVIRASPRRARNLVCTRAQVLSIPYAGPNEQPSKYPASRERFSDQIRVNPTIQKMPAIDSAGRRGIEGKGEDARRSSKPWTF
jgi:hypothetical protein